MGELFTVNQLAEDLGITARAIRFYETKGLIEPRRVGTTRVFDRRDRTRLKLILRGKRLGFSLRDIKEYLDLYDIDPSGREQMKAVLVKLRKRIALLDQQRRDLETTLDELRDLEQAMLTGLGGDGPPGPPRSESV